MRLPEALRPALAALLLAALAGTVSATAANAAEAPPARPRAAAAVDLPEAPAPPAPPDVEPPELPAEAMPGEEPASVAIGEREEALRDEAEDLYEVDLRSSGLLLRPIDEIEGVRRIDVAPGAVRVDGEALDEPALRERVGSRADLLLDLSRLDLPTMRGLFGGGTGVDELEEELQRAERERERIEEELQEQLDRDPPKVRSDARVAVGSRVTVDENEVSDDVVAIGGSVKVEGTVRGSAVAVGGGVDIAGKVLQDVVSVGGKITLGPDAEVMGDVVAAGGEIDRHPDARVYGEVSEVAIGAGLGPLLGGRVRIGGDADDDDDDEDFSFDGPLAVAMKLFWSALGVMVLALLCGLALVLARAPVERLEAQVETEPGKTFLVGVLAQLLFLPLLVLTVIILVISIVGIPLLVLLPFALLALVLAAIAGFAAVALCTGRWLGRRFGWSLPTAVVAMLVGVLAIHVWSLFGRLLDIGSGPLNFFAVMFLFAGFMVKYVAWTMGFGAVLLTRFGTSWGARPNTFGTPPGGAPGQPPMPPYPSLPPPFVSPAGAAPVGVASVAAAAPGHDATAAAVDSASRRSIFDPDATFEPPPTPPPVVSSGGWSEQAPPPARDESADTPTAIGPGPEGEPPPAVEPPPEIPPEPRRRDEE